MHAIKLTNKHKDLFYLFLESQKDYAILHNRQWNLPLDTKSIIYNLDNRQLFGVFDNNELIAVGGYKAYTFAPYRLLDTFTIKFSLSISNISKIGGILANCILEDCVNNNIFTVYHVGELRMWKTLGFSKRGFFWKHVPDWQPKTVSIIPANQKSKYKMINSFLEERQYPVDMLVYKVEYDTNKLSDEELIEHG